MKRILITGFEPFSDIKKNPSEVLVHDLSEALSSHSDLQVTKIILPVDYQKADAVLKPIDFSHYDFVFQFGVAAKRQRVSLERVALNWIESQIPDNSGTHITQKKIDSDSPEAKFNLLDLAGISHELNLQYNNCVEVSLSAGAYLCNFVYFKTLTKTAQCLFIHIPTRLKTSEHEWSHESPEYRSFLKSLGLDLIKLILLVE